MSKPTANVIPLRPARSQRIDLALAVAVLSKGVEAHERVRRVRLALQAQLAFSSSVGAYAHAKSLGA